MAKGLRDFLPFNVFLVVYPLQYPQTYARFDIYLGGFSKSKSSTSSNMWARFVD